MANADIRIGKVSSIDYKNGMISVIYTDKDKSVTSDLPYLTYNNEYFMPKIGASVLVLHLSNGSSRGIALGNYWNLANSPHETGKNIYRKDMSNEEGEAFQRYDSKSHKYLLNAPTIELEDNSWKTTLSNIMERLAALDNDYRNKK